MVSPLTLPFFSPAFSLPRKSRLVISQFINNKSNTSLQYTEGFLHSISLLGVSPYLPCPLPSPSLSTLPFLSKVFLCNPDWLWLLIKPRLVLNSWWSACFSLLCTEITSVDHYTWPEDAFYIIISSFSQTPYLTLNEQVKWADGRDSESGRNTWPHGFVTFFFFLREEYVIVF